MDEPTVVAELRQREHPWQKPEKYVVSMSDGEVVTYVPERTCHWVKKNSHNSWIYCSNCGSDLGRWFNYCPSCRSKVLKNFDNE